MKKWRALPWKEIQKFYDDNGTYRSILKRFNLNPCCLDWAKHNNLLKFRTHRDAMKLGSQLKRMQGANIWTPSMREDARIRMLGRIESDPNNHPNRKLAGNRNKMSFPERIGFDYFTSIGLVFEHNKYIKPYWVDFLLGKNMIVEIDGARWHDKAKDEIRDKALNNMGYTVIRFQAKDVMKDKTILSSNRLLGKQ